MLAEIIPKIAAAEAAGEKGHTYYPRPSMAGPQRCLRQTVYSAMGLEKKPLAGRAIMVFDDSSWHEELTSDWLRKSAFQVHSEQMSITIPDAFPFMPDGTRGCGFCPDAAVRYKDCHGHIDWICTDMVGNDFLVEHKALSHFGFEGLMKGDIPYDYFTQMAIYMRGLQQDNPKLRDCVLLVKNKNQSGYLEFNCEYERKADTFRVNDRRHHTGEAEKIGRELLHIVKNAFNRFLEVDAHRRTGTLPERQYERTHWRCEYCPYTETCWKGWVKEQGGYGAGAKLSEITSIVDMERHAAKEEAAARKEKEEHRGHIKGYLKEKGLRAGVAGGWEVEWSVSERTKEDTSLLAPELRKIITVSTIQERLTIKRAKVAKGEK